MAQFRQVEGAGHRAGKRKQKPAEQPNEDWTSDWRMEGVPQDTRFRGMGSAQAANRRVRSMKPANPKGRRQITRRPCPETAERVVHSKGKRWDEFEKQLGGNLSDYEKRIVFDGRKIGGAGTFADWKQSQYKNRKIVSVDKVIHTLQGPMMAVKNPETDKIELVPYVPSDKEEREKLQAKKSKPRKKKDLFATHCEKCGIQLPTSRRSEAKCVGCAPVAPTVTAFAAALKQKMSPK